MTALSSSFSTLTLTLSICLNAQANDRAIQQKVLEEAIIDSSFIFGKWTEKGGTETHLRYLGKITTKHGQTFKILNSTWFFGLSHRANSKILVFNDKNKYVGNYHVTLIADLPTKLEDGKLIFKNTDEDCDKSLTTIIDLKNGLPKEFFRKCKGTYGDFYSFNSE